MANNRFASTYHEFKCVSLNVNSLVSNFKRLELVNFLNYHDVDIAMLNETKLERNHVLYFKNYNIIRNDRSYGKGGGTAIIIKKTFNFKIIDLKKKYATLETTIIQIDLSDDCTLLVAAIYARKGKNSDFIWEIGDLFASLKLNSPKVFYFLGGDYNAKHTSWSNDVNNERGITLSNWRDNVSIKYKLKLYHSLTASYPKKNSFIDLILADARLIFKNSINNKLNTENFPSDHQAVMATFSISDRNFNDITVTNINNYLFSKINFIKFQKILSKFNLDINPNHNIDLNTINKNLLLMNNAIIEAMERSSPKRSAINSTDKYINNVIRKLQTRENFYISKLRSLRKSNWQNSTKDHLIHNLGNMIAAVRRKIKFQIERSVTTYWFNRVAAIDPRKPVKFFSEINKLFRSKNRQNIDILKVGADKDDLLLAAGIDNSSTECDDCGNSIIRDDKAKADLLAAHYTSVNNKNELINNVVFRNLVDGKVSALLEEISLAHPTTVCTFNQENNSLKPEQPLTCAIYFTTQDIVRHKFKSLNNKKSAGNDKIPNFILRKLPNNFIRFYTILFNNLLNYGFFPDIWKSAKVISLLKKGKSASDINGYRPISMLPNLGKIYEKVINDIILNVCSNNDVISENQYGFKKRHSTMHAVNKLSSDVNWALNGGKCVGACLVDLEKAFDTVWINGLVYKLAKKKFPLIVIKLIISMISNRSFRVMLGNMASNLCVIKNGLQQGTINSPILFNIYTDDILRLFGPDKTGCSAIAFADDLIVYRAGKDPKKVQAELQLTINKIFNYYTSWKLKVNVDKCETILFRPSIRIAWHKIAKNYKSFCISADPYSGKKIIHKKEVKYLGVYLDERFLLNSHPLLQLKKARSVYILCARLFQSRALSAKAKIICYLTLIRPILTYGCEIWYNISASLMEKFRVFERRCLRACLGLYRTAASNYTKDVRNLIVYEKANINRIDNFIIKLVRNYFANAASISCNSLIFPIPYPDDNYIKVALVNGFVPPEAFVFVDRLGLVQNRKAIPLLYHISRHRANKSILYSAYNLQHEFATSLPVELGYRYDARVPSRDIQEVNKLNYLYCWWLEDRFKHR